MPDKHPITGCRADTIFGEWMILSGRLESFTDTGWAILEKGELQAAQARSREIVEAEENRPYTVQDGVARLAVSGPITKLDTSMMSIFGGTSTMRVRKSLAEIRQKFSSGEIKAVFLEVDSPGGTVDGTPELAYAIRKTAAIMPVFVHASDMACSAALWIATQGSRFTAGPAALIGSLGTRQMLTDASKLGQDSQLKPIVIDSGKFKSIGAPGKPITQEQMAELERYVGALNAVFKGEVQKARGMTAAQIEEAATARVYVGQGAVAVGLIDAVCSTEEAMEYAKANINNPKLVRRDPSMVGKPPVASNRSSHMPLTASQITELRTLPGAASATEDTADTAAFHAAMQLNQQVKALTTASSTATQDVTRLTQELAAAKGALPQKMDPRVLKSMCNLACQELQMKLRAGTITSVQFTKLAGALMSAGEFKDGKLSADAVPIEAMFQEVGATGEYVYNKVFAALDDNKPNGVLTDISGHQPAGRTEPGRDDDSKSEAKTFGLAKANALRDGANLPPLTQAAFDATYPESAGNR